MSITYAPINNALQGLLHSAFACHVAPAERPEWYRPRSGAGENLFRLESPTGIPIFLHSVGGKAQLPTATRLRLRTERLADNDVLGICFDPDAQDEAAWRQAIEQRITAVGFSPQRFGWHYAAGGAPDALRVVPFPWHSPSERIPKKLPNTQSLYRTTAQGLALAFPRRARLINRWTRKAWRCGTPPDWKTVCWFWMAAWHPETECDHFFRHAFSLAEVHETLRESGNSRPWWDGIGLIAQ